MGRPGYQPQFDQSSTIAGTDQSSSASINHFSHPHPLQLSNPQPQRSFNSNSCAGCKKKGLRAGIQLHHLQLLPPPEVFGNASANHSPFRQRPCYAEGFFNCDACGKQGQGFCYRCKICFTDLHILCAALPMNINHQIHHHQLKVIFSPHYSEKVFLCDICYDAGSFHWLYNCDMCDFDAHLDCATNVAVEIQRKKHQSQTTSDLDQMQILSTGSTSTPQQFPTNSRSSFSYYPYMPMVDAPACGPSWQRPNTTGHGPIQQLPSDILSAEGEAISGGVFGGLQDLFQGLSVSNGGQNTSSPPSAGGGDGSGQHNLHQRYPWS